MKWWCGSRKTRLRLKKKKEQSIEKHIVGMTSSLFLSVYLEPSLAPLPPPPFSNVYLSTCLTSVRRSKKRQKPTKVVTPVCLVLPPGLLAGSGASDEFRCEPCNKNLTSLTRLKRHIQNVHTRPSKEPICNICKRVYSSLNSLRNHKSIYHRQHNKSEQQKKEVAQIREWQRDQREHTERNYPAQQQQQQQHQAQQHPRMG